MHEEDFRALVIRSWKTQDSSLDYYAMKQFVDNLKSLKRVIGEGGKIHSIKAQEDLKEVKYGINLCLKMRR